MERLSLRCQSEAGRTTIEILAWDLENSPISGYVWGLFDQNIGLNQIISVTEVICFGARWIDGKNKGKRVVIKSGFRDGKQVMLDTLWSLLDQADAVVSWNGASFDTKHAQREFIQAGMRPPSPYKEIDLMRVVKNKFRAPSNKLDYWADLLLGHRKVDTGGFQLWKGCMDGNEKAWRTMYRYQKQDVDLLVDLYEILLPWITNHPNRALIDGLGIACIACGSVNLQKRGYSVTGVCKYQRYQCQDCGKWLKDGKSIPQAERVLRPAT
jgi:hypothetical protein